MGAFRLHQAGNDLKVSSLSDPNLLHKLYAILQLSSQRFVNFSSSSQLLIAAELS